MLLQTSARIVEQQKKVWTFCCLLSTKPKLTVQKQQQPSKPMHIGAFLPKSCLDMIFLYQCLKCSMYLDGISEGMRQISKNTKPSLQKLQHPSKPSHIGTFLLKYCLDMIFDVFVWKCICVYIESSKDMSRQILRDFLYTKILSDEILVKRTYVHCWPDCKCCCLPSLLNSRPAQIFLDKNAAKKKIMLFQTDRQTHVF